MASTQPSWRVNPAAESRPRALCPSHQGASPEGAIPPGMQMAKGGATEQHGRIPEFGLWGSLRRNGGRGGSNDRDTGEFQRWNPRGLSQKYGNQEPTAVRTPKGGLSPSRPVSSFPRSLFVSFSLVSPSAYVDPCLWAFLFIPTCAPASSSCHQLFSLLLCMHVVPRKERTNGPTPWLLRSWHSST